MPVSVLDGRAEASRHWALEVSRSARAQPPEPARRLAHVAALPPRAAAQRDVRAGASRACCPEPALRSAQVSPLEQVRSPVQPRRGGRRVRPAKEMASPSAQAQDGPQEPLQAAVLAVWEPDAPRAEPLRAAVLAAWEPDVPRAEPQPEELAPAHAAAEPLLEAAMAASVRQAAGAAAGERGAPRVAEAAAVSGARVLQPAAAQPEDAVVPLRAAGRSDVPEPQAAEPLVGSDARRAAVPLAVASVARQGPSLAGPARQRAAVRLAHAMQSLRFASRLEPSLQAERSGS